MFRDQCVRVSEAQLRTTHRKTVCISRNAACCIAIEARSGLAAASGKRSALSPLSPNDRAGLGLGVPRTLRARKRHGSLAIAVRRKVGKLTCWLYARDERSNQLPRISSSKALRGIR